jgi:hypothetical protein
MNSSQRRVLEEHVREQAVKFVSDHGLLPNRQEIVQQVNEAAAMLKQAAGVEVRFE